jgi:endonuclease-3
VGCPREGLKERKARALAVLRALKEAYPGARTELKHNSPFQLLVATVLSAQATDRSVNEATPALFARFPDAKALAEATPEEVEPYIRRIGLYKTKAKNLVALAQRLVAEYGGEVPRSKEALMRLPGVGWKTATVVLGAAFGVPGIAVDTHVARLSRRLCLTEAKRPEKIGRDLESLFPKEDWVFVHHALVLHGRYVCTARRPRCGACVLAPYCPSREA